MKTFPMLFDTTLESHVGYEDLPGCCAIGVVQDFPDDYDTEDVHWLALCDLFAWADYRKGVLVSLSQRSQTKMIDLLEATPYATKLQEFKSCSGKHLINLYSVLLIKE